MAISLPTQGLSNEQVLDHLRVLGGHDVNWRGHRAFGLVYHHSDAHTELMQEAHNLFLSANGLNPMAFKSLRRMEHEVVRISAGLFHGDDATVGTMSSGGTESILLAMLAYRQHARSHRTLVRHPEVIVPESAHAAFYKAGEYFDIKVISVPLQKDYRADVDAMAACINRNTIALVGSAPCYPYGVIDPIVEIAALGLKHGLPVHVDACLGGFLLPFVERLTPEERIADIPPFDFRVPGVTSISADLHKYGYAAKGASVILYSDMAYLRHQFSASTDWCGGVYVSPTLAGTRPGGAIAGAWAALHSLGEEGYVSNARAAMETAKTFIEGINAIPELEVLGNPPVTIVAYGGRGPDLGAYAVGDQLEARGWHVDRLQRPESLHMILNPGHLHVADVYLADLREAVAYVKTHPDTAFEGSAPMYGLIAKAPLRKLVKKQVFGIVEQMYSATGGGSVAELSAESAEAGDAPKEGAIPSLPPLLIRAMRVKARLRRLFGRA
jgi:glutamate/tyrosine decarboxylase-like PLP-dependent enzyme